MLKVCYKCFVNVYKLEVQTHYFSLLRNYFCGKALRFIFYDFLRMPKGQKSIFFTFFQVRLSLFFSNRLCLITKGWGVPIVEKGGGGKIIYLSSTEWDFDVLEVQLGIKAVVSSQQTLSEFMFKSILTFALTEKSHRYSN